MALQKSIEQSSGAIVSYWKIPTVDIKYTYDSDTEITIVLEGYVDAQTRADGHRPAARRIFKLDNPATWTALCGEDGKTSNSDNPVKLGYDWIKANIVGFATAVDC
jgi:hypothetical protein